MTRWTPAWLVLVAGCGSNGMPAGDDLGSREVPFPVDAAPAILDAAEGERGIPMDFSTVTTDLSGAAGLDGPMAPTDLAVSTITDLTISPPPDLALPGSCGNGKRDGSETDVDCGGGLCARCMPGKMCLHGSDCDSGVCSNNLCQAPSCADGVQNGDETDVDCGASCPKCGLGKMCLKGVDCTSALCTNNICQTSQCTDGKRDGNETDVDCGGGICPACGAARMCHGNSDCASGVCAGARCVGSGPAQTLSFDAVEVAGGTTCGLLRLVTGDFNGDGLVDVAGGSVCGTLPIFLGKGTGLLGKVGELGIGKDFVTLATADFNGDGLLDLAGTDRSKGTVTIALNQGGGALAAQAMFPSGAVPLAIASGDFNQDGHPDVVVANPNADAITVLLLDGKGRMISTRSVAAGPSPIALVAVDVTKDGVLDLLVASGSFPSFYVLQGNAAGGFQPLMSFATGGKADSLVVGDFNGDKLLDVALGLPGTISAVNVLLGMGGGAFEQPGTLYSTGGSPTSLALADFNTDGAPDLAVGLTGVAGMTNTGVAILLGSGAGNFRLALTLSAMGGVDAVAAPDLNADGRPDLVLGRATTATLFSALNTSQ